MRIERAWLAAIALAATASGCRRDMQDQPRYDPLEASDFFDDGRASRPKVEGTVARGQLREDPHLYTGRVNGELATSFPFPVTRETLTRGREQFQIFCRPCHGGLGNGNGVVVQRGFTQPTSFHDPRLRSMAPGYVFDVVTNGFGAMTSYASRVPPEDRWAIAAYIKALQLSQNARLEDVPEDVRRELSEDR